VQAAVFVGGYGGNPLFVKKSPILCGFRTLKAGGLAEFAQWFAVFQEKLG